MSNEIRRNGWQILKEILMVAKKGTIKTRMVYKANSNFKYIQQYIDIALKNGLLEERNGRYYTTEKGISVILHILNLEAMLTL